MGKWIMRVGAVVIAAVVVFGMVADASAQGPDGQQEEGVKPVRHMVLVLAGIVSEETGLSVDDLKVQVREGKSLAELCTENGVDPQAVYDAAKTQLIADIEQALADGKITEERAERMLGNLDDALDAAMNASGPDGLLLEMVQNRIERTLVDQAAEQLGMQAKDVLQEWRRSDSLAAVIEAHGGDVIAVLDATEAQVTGDVNQAVADGKITQEQADKVLANLRVRLERRMNTKLPAEVDPDRPGRERPGQNEPAQNAPAGDSVGT
ncbi:MAG: hypothetical protein JW966_09120 [Anaerolineae bacterium]|nr:hypothetical protein [Anaerolineae bacterium]